MAILYRTVGAWGAGTGANLTAAQIDGNFYDIEGRLETLETTPLEAVGIDHFVIDGTLLTIVMSDGSTHGPFVLPVAQWRWTGLWASGITYLPGDIVVIDGAVYQVRVMHVSEGTFDPTLYAPEGIVYVKILDKPAQPYDIALFWNDVITSGTDILVQHCTPREYTIGQNFENCIAFLQVKTDVTFALPVYRTRNADLLEDGETDEAEVLGLITFDQDDAGTTDGGQYGLFAAVDYDVDIVFRRGDRITITQPYEDPTTAKQLSVTLVATVSG